MPTLLRFLTVIAVIGGLIYGGIFTLATFFDPEPRVTAPPLSDPVAGPAMPPASAGSPTSTWPWSQHRWAR